jgi:peptidoglycan biosynthesis protein MviN/MurJ (putative lipid II flippase)
MTQPRESQLERLADLLLDRNHPFWSDERQKAEYNEAAAAALQLQTFALVIVAGLALLVGGRPVLGAVTALVLAGTCGQWLMLGLLTRRNVEVFPKGWRHQASSTRKAVSLACGLFYLGCYMWVSMQSNTFDRSTVVGVVAGAATGALAVYILTKRLRRRGDANQ